MPIQPSHATPIARPRRHLWRWIGAAAVAGIFLAVAGPFGTYLYEGTESRFGYWIAAALIGLAVYSAAFAAATRIAPPGTPAHWPVLLGAILLASALQALVTRTTAFALWPGLAGHDPSWAEWYANTLLIGSVAALGYSAFQRRRVPVSPDAPMPTTPPLPWPADLLALQMEDHYVRVHTARGSQLILMPLGRAISAAGKEGLQVHRSWWVARDAVGKIGGTPRSMHIRLVNGLVAPVARSAVAKLRIAGWI